MRVMQAALGPERRLEVSAVRPVQATFVADLQ